LAGGSACPTLLIQDIGDTRYDFVPDGARIHVDGVLKPE
jgi:hypothetical protein